MKHGPKFGNCEAVREGSSVVRVDEEADRVKCVECGLIKTSIEQPLLRLSYRLLYPRKTLCLLFAKVYKLSNEM